MQYIEVTNPPVEYKTSFALKEQVKKALFSNTLTYQLPYKASDNLYNPKCYPLKNS